MSLPPWARGPLPASVTLPTRWVRVLGGALVVENPNVCAVCRRRRHRDRPHHSFTPDRAIESLARGLGWPIPEKDLRP